MPIVLQRSSSKSVLASEVGKRIRPALLLHYTTAREGMRRWGLTKFGTNQILGASLTSTGFYYSARYMQVKQV